LFKFREVWCKFFSRSWNSTIHTRGFEILTKDANPSKSWKEFAVRLKNSWKKLGNLTRIFV
jgi:hypothetical protein